jgi:dethiobiotin synthetase
VFVSGTGTGVGKTWWTAAVARGLRDRGVAVAARKPAQSGDDEPSDAVVLADATGAHPDEVCPPHRRYRRAWAPPMAAEDAGAPPFGVADLVAELQWPASTDIGFVEGAGGPRSPIAADADNVDLARALRPDVVLLVADAGLGTINAVRLSADALADFTLVVALNRFDDNLLHEQNRAYLTRRACLDVVTSPSTFVTRLRESRS